MPFATGKGILRRGKTLPHPGEGKLHPWAAFLASAGESISSGAWGHSVLKKFVLACATMEAARVL